jgi:hypothetical protein
MPKKPNTASPQIDSVKSLAASKNSAEQGSNDKGLANADNVVENLMPLMQQRRALIEQLFSEHRPEQISLAAESLQQMVDLDTALNQQAKSTKLVLMQQVVTLQNSKKVTQSYQKY